MNVGVRAAGGYNRGHGYFAAREAARAFDLGGHVGGLAQQVRELNARQKAAKKEGASGAGTMKDLKEATAVLKDLAGVAKTLNDQGAQAEGAECGVVLLPTVEEEP